MFYSKENSLKKKGKVQGEKSAGQEEVTQMGILGPKDRFQGWGLLGKH